MTIERGAARNVEMPGKPPALIDFLIFHHDETIVLEDFTPVDRQQADYIISLNKFEKIEGTGDKRVLVKKLRVSDREIEQAKTWALKAVYATFRKCEIESEGGVLTGNQVLEVDKQVREIDEYATESILGFLSADEVSVTGISTTDSVSITVVKQAEDADGTKKQESLTITDAKFADVKMRARAEKLRKITEIAQTEVLDNNIALISGLLAEYNLERQAALAK